MDLMVELMQWFEALESRFMSAVVDPNPHDRMTYLDFETNYTIFRKTKNKNKTHYLSIIFSPESYFTLYNHCQNIWISYGNIFQIY